MLLLAPRVAMAQIPSYLPTNGLVGWWPFNGNANDESGNGNNGTVNGASLTPDRFGVANKAYDFSSAEQDFISAAQSGMSSTTGTFSLWVNFSGAIGGGNPLLALDWYTLIEPILLNGYASDSRYQKLILNWGNQPISSSTLSFNSWHFVIVTISPSGQTTFYIDGVNSGSQQITGNYTLLSATNLFFFGKSSNNAWYWNGKLDDIAIYNRVLTQQEISNLYSTSPPPSITTSASPSLINCGETATLTASTTSSATPCAKADLPPSLQNGLVGYWPFCGNANDASGNANNGAVNGATLTTDRFGNANSAYSFDGVDDYIMTSFQGVLGNNARTISFWANPEINSGDNYVFSYGSLSEGQTLGTYVRCGTSVNFVTATNNAATVYSGTDFCDSWSLFTVVIPSGGVTQNQIQHYVNGVLVSNLSYFNPGVVINTGNASTFQLARLFYNLTFNYFKGRIDDVGFWDRALSASEIQQLYTLNNVSYAWSTGASTPSISVTPSSTSTYTCTATNSGGSTTSSVTVNVVDSLTWTGAVDTDWHKPCNWSPQFVPKCCNNVTVPLTINQPIVSGIAAAEDLTIYTTNGALVTVNNGANLQIADCPTTVTTTSCPSLAVVVTAPILNTTQLIPVSGGTISYPGASAITARGVCWSTSPNPTLANGFSSDGAGIGTFTSNLTGLTAGTTYYVRAYATNAGGTSYGNELSFVYSPVFALGDSYGGGIVAYLFQAGEQGYVAGEQHGIICSPSDQSGGIQWYNGSYCCKTWANDDAIGFGQINTTKILTVQGVGTYAASLTDNFVLDGYSDWFLPSINELQMVYANRALIGGFSGIYWSSSEFSAGWNYVKVVSFDQGWTGSRAKAIACKVRAIRYF